MAAKNKKPANMSAVRKALGEIRKYAVTARDHSDNQQIVEDAMLGIVETIDAALAKPPRNCDVGAAEEQYRRFMAMCNSKDGRQCSTCEFRRNCYTGRDECFARWAQMPYEPGYDMGD